MTRDRREVLCQWNNKEPGLTGRIGMPWTEFLRFGGYDEDLLGMGYQDVHLINRARLVAAVVLVTDYWVGCSLPNQENAQGLLEQPKKARIVIWIFRRFS